MADHRQEHSRDDQEHRVEVHLESTSFTWVRRTASRDSRGGPQEDEELAPLTYGHALMNTLLSRPWPLCFTRYSCRYSAAIVFPRRDPEIVTSCVVGGCSAPRSTLEPERSSTDRR
eukprot:gnl/TRDRNA2_/TRDRNA2_147048_c1_seq1.p1 gnl/TRDRNA2_/TRDRNA2_147048_c1~~gnl/TRDRNA2_/TRDRNA2_147048_c1_seq1.p1  ORF type:complete len:116 (+),score=5.51 gnl/TRDRNA2_/TRDRNA2_147048_c1_seq1:111-458(+)